MASPSPKLVEPTDLYDGPEPSPPGVNFLPPPPESKSARARPDYAAILTAALDVLGARLLGLIATIAACLLWGWAVYQPETLRTYAALGFSLTVLAPIVAVYFKRG
jgi:hypothetical protein